MSNPYMNKTIPLLADQDSAYLQVENRKVLLEYEAKFAPTNADNVLWDMLAPLDMERKFSIVVPPSMIIAGDLKGDLRSMNRELTKQNRAFDPLDRSQWIMAKTSTKKLVFIRRTAQGYAFRKVLERALLDYEPRLALEVRRNIMTKVATIPSPKHCLGRFLKSYPRRGAEVQSISPGEATSALIAAGLGLTRLYQSALEDKVPPRYLFNGDPIEGKQIRLNLQASAGLPFGGTLKDEAVRAAVFELAYSMYDDIKRLLVGAPKVPPHATIVGPELRRKVRLPDYNYVRKVMQQLAGKRPELFGVIMKAKADVVSIEKCADQNRIINNIPAYARVLMSCGTQPLIDEFGFNILGSAWEFFRSFKGVKMMGDELSASIHLVALCRRTHVCRGTADLHYDFGIMGDDSHINFRYGNFVGIASLDVTNMDMSQHADLTQNVHLQMYEAVAVVCPVAAALWVHFMRDKTVVLEGASTVGMTHGATSGIAMIDVNNGAVMAVFITRMFDVLAILLTEDYEARTEMGLVGIMDYEISAYFTEAVQRVAKEMGLGVRVDGLYVTSFQGTPFAEDRFIGNGVVLGPGEVSRADERDPHDFLHAAALMKHETGRSFIFLGHEISSPYTLDELVERHAPFVGRRRSQADLTIWVAIHDMPRLMGSISYKKKAYIAQDKLAAKEAARLAATFMALGRGDARFYDRVVAPLKPIVIRMLKDQIDMGHGDVSENQGQYLVAVGPEQDQSIQGLYDFYVRGGFEELWKVPNPNGSYAAYAMSIAIPGWRAPDSEGLTEESDPPLLVDPMPSLAVLAQRTLGVGVAKEGVNVIKAADREPAAAPLTKKNFGRQPPTRVRIWWEKVRGAMEHMSDEAQVGPKKGPVKALKDWKTQFNALGDDLAYSDDEEPPYPTFRKAWADYSDSDEEDKEYERTYQEDRAAWADAAMDDTEDFAEDNNARARAGYG